MNVYTDLSLLDAGGALEALPELSHLKLGDTVKRALSRDGN